MLIRTALSTAIITFMVAGSASLVTIMTLSKAPQTITAFITGITSNKYIILFCLDILLFGLGMILHGNAIIMLVIPLALPIMKALGVNPIHFGILMCLGVGIGQQTPPVIGFVDDLLHCQGHNSGGMEVFEVVFARIRRLLDVHHIYSVDIKLYRVIKKE